MAKYKYSETDKREYNHGFDEFPWLNSRRSGFLEALDHFWNTWASRQSYLIVVICGSAASWMIDNESDYPIHPFVAFQPIRNKGVSAKSFGQLRSLPVVAAIYGLGRSASLFEECRTCTLSPFQLGLKDAVIHTSKFKSNAIFIIVADKICFTNAPVLFMDGVLQFTKALQQATTAPLPLKPPESWVEAFTALEQLLGTNQFGLVRRDRTQRRNGGS